MKSQNMMYFYVVILSVVIVLFNVHIYFKQVHTVRLSTEIGLGFIDSLVIWLKPQFTVMHETEGLLYNNHTNMAVPVT